MSTVYSVKLQQLIDEFQLEKIFIPDDDNILVTRSDLNRPGLALSGFFGHFEPARIQLIGNCEHTYLNSFPESSLAEHIDSFMSKKPVAVIFTTSLTIFPVFIEKAKKICCSSSPYGTAYLRIHGKPNIISQCGPCAPNHTSRRFS